MVYLDQKIQQDLGVFIDRPVDRRYQARLVRKLKADGAKLILFDFLFINPSADPKADQEFAEAITNHGRVVLAGDLDYGEQANGSLRTLKPIALLRNAAAAWGTASLPADPRQLEAGPEVAPSVSWVSAALLSSNVANNSNRLQERWLNHYARPDEFTS
jgi:CHASE2 domain-containing sensor protein